MNSKKIKIIPEFEEDKEIADQMSKMLKWLIANPNARPDEYVKHFIEEKEENDNITIETCQNNEKTKD
jgi:hypothetical protein